MDASDKDILMGKSSISALQNSAGFAWASSGLGVLILTLTGVGWIQLLDPVPPEGVFFLLALGCFPAALAMLIGLRNGIRAKKKLSDVASVHVRSSGICTALAGLGMLAVGVAIFTGDCWRRETQKTQWVQEAQVAVEKLLHAADRIPADMRVPLGSFTGLTGHGFGGAAWNIQGYEYLIADRDAHFANAKIPVRIYVTEGRKTNPGIAAIVVQAIKRDSSSLYLSDAPLPKRPIEGLRVTVSHPALGRL